MKFEFAIIAAMLATLVTGAVNAHPAQHHHKHAMTVPHRTAGAPATTAGWTLHTNSYRSVEGK